MDANRPEPQGAVSRRAFIKQALVLSAMAGMAGQAVGGDAPAPPPAAPASGPAVPRRAYGRSRVPVSVIGFGGMLASGLPQEEVNRLVAEAVERGVNYFDVAPTYGNSEQLVGPALEPYRKDCFLACKTTRRDAAGAREELDRSLERLKTDYLDLYQLHAVTDVAKDVDSAFATGGAMEPLLEAHRSGRIRHLGISAHSEEAALAALERYAFDSVLFPVSFPTWFAGGRFGARVLDKVRETGATMLALKALALQKWPKDAPGRKAHPKCWYQPVLDPELAGLALRFTLGHGAAVAIPPGEPALFRLALDLAADLRPLDESEHARLQRTAEGLDPIFRARPPA